MRHMGNAMAFFAFMGRNKNGAVGRLFFRIDLVCVSCDDGEDK